MSRSTISSSHAHARKSWFTTSALIPFLTLLCVLALLWMWTAETSHVFGPVDSKVCARLDGKLCTDEYRDWHIVEKP